MTRYLFDDAGGVMSGVTGPVCPTDCECSLTPGQKVRIGIEDLLDPAGALQSVRT